jgi:hypothetical protein
MHIIEEALAEDEPKAAVEYLNRWREDLSDLILLDVVSRAAVTSEINESPAPRGVNYAAYCDRPAAPSGLMLIAWRYAATASSSLPWSLSALPRLEWASAKSGLMPAA